MQELLSRLAALEEQVAELRAQLDKARYRPMRDARSCPACGSRSLIHFRRVRETGDNVLVELGLDHHQSVWRGITTRGPLEAHACRACRLVEWHALDFNHIAPGEHVVFLEPEPAAPDKPRDPYR